MTYLIKYDIIIIVKEEIKLNKEEVLIKALYIAGKYARENIPAEINYDYINELVNGENDPQGLKYIIKWLTMAENELRGKEE